MALTRAFLRSMGLEDDKIQAIIEAHSESVTALKDENRATSAELAEAQDKLKKAGESDSEWKTKCEKLQKDFDDYKADEEKQKAIQAKESAYKILLEQAGVSNKHMDKIIRLNSAELDKMEYENGKLKDEKNILENIKAEWGDFIGTKGTQGVGVGNPPSNGGNTMTKETIMAIKDTKKRQQAIADNIELFQK